jgi:hypothetical protein
LKVYDSGLLDDDDDDRTPEYAPKVKRTIKYDYCSHMLISDETEYVDSF